MSTLYNNFSNSSKYGRSGRSNKLSASLKPTNAFNNTTNNFRELFNAKQRKLEATLRGVEGKIHNMYTRKSQIKNINNIDTNIIKLQNSKNPVNIAKITTLRKKKENLLDYMPEKPEEQEDLELDEILIFLRQKHRDLRKSLKKKAIINSILNNQKEQKLAINKQKENNKLKRLKLKKDILAKLKHILYDPTFNIEEWRQIPNSGQNNCGIFIQDADDTKIVKCENSDATLLKYNALCNLKLTHKIMPDIYRYTFKTNDYVNVTYYFEMERLALDITQLLFENLLKRCIDEYNIQYNINLSEDDKLKIYKLFHILLPKTTNVFVNIYLLKTHSEESKKLLYELLHEFIPLNFNKKIYNDIIDYYIKKLIKVEFQIFEQILLLQIYCFKYNIIFTDLKLDNFGILFKDTNDLYLDETVPLKNNKYYEKYFFVYVLDIESGIIQDSTLKYTKIKSLQHWSKYGQYKFTKISIKLNYDIILSLLDPDDKTNEQYLNFISIICDQEEEIKSELFEQSQ